MWPFSLLPIPPLPPLPPERTWYPNICKDQLNPYNPSINTFWYLPRDGMPLESAPAPVQGMAARLVMWLSAVLPVSSQTQSTLERVVAWLVPATVPRGASTYELNACMHVFKPAGPIYTHPTVLWIVQIVLTVFALYYTVLLVFKLHSGRVAFIAQSDATGGHIHIDQNTWLQRFTSLARAARNTFHARPVLAQHDQDTWLQRFTSVGRAVRNTFRLQARVRLPARQDTNENPDWRDWFKLDTAQRARVRGWRVPTVRVPSLIQRVDVGKMRDFRSWFKRPVPSPLEVPLPVSRSSSPWVSRSPSPVQDFSTSPVEDDSPIATPVPFSPAPSRPSPSQSPAAPRQAAHSPTPHHSRASLADLLAAWDESSHAQTQTLPLLRPRSVSPSIPRPLSVSPSISRSLSPLAPLEGRRALRPKLKTRRRRSGSLDSPRRDREVKSWSEPVTDAEMDDARRCKSLDLANLRVDMGMELRVDVGPVPVLEAETTISLAPADPDAVQALDTFDAQPTLLEGTIVSGVEALGAPPSAPTAFEDTIPEPATAPAPKLNTDAPVRSHAPTLHEGTTVLGVEAHGAPPSAPAAFEDAPLHVESEPTTAPGSATIPAPEIAAVAPTDATAPLIIDTVEVAPVTNDAQTEVLTVSDVVDSDSSSPSSSSNSSALEPVTPTSPVSATVPAPVLVAVDSLPPTEPPVVVPPPVIENNPIADRRTFWTLDDGSTPSSPSPRGRKSRPTATKLPAPAPVENNPHVDVKTFYDDSDTAPSPGKKRRNRKKKTHAEQPRNLVQKQDVAQDRPPSPRAPPAKVVLEPHVAQDHPMPAPVTPSRIPQPQRQTPLRIPQPQLETLSSPPKTPRIILPPGFTQALRGVIQPPLPASAVPPMRVPFNQNYPTPGAGPSVSPSRWKPKPHFARSGPRASDRANQQHHLEAFGAPLQYAVPSSVSGRENVIAESPAPAPTPAPAPASPSAQPDIPASESEEEEEEDAPRKRGRRRCGAAWRLRVHGYGTADIDWLYLNWPTEYSKPSRARSPSPDSLLPP